MTKKKTEELDVTMEVTENAENETESAVETNDEISAPEEMPTEENSASPPKKKRAAKKKTEEVTEIVEEVTEDIPDNEEPPEDTDVDEELPILTINVGGEAQTDNERAEIVWHEIRTSHIARRTLTGMLGGIEQLENGTTVAIVDYKGYRIVIPLKEMGILTLNGMHPDKYKEYVSRQQKLLNNMLGADIDFIVKGIDIETRSVVASRKDAMLKKRKTFYMEHNEDGSYKIYNGRIVQARVLAVAEKGIRVEIFGVECSIMARDLSWDWIGDAHDRFSVGDHILVRVLSVERESLENITVTADVKSVTEPDRRPNLSLCRVQSKYAGRVTDVHNGVIYVRLTNGVNAIAHSCYDRRLPGKKDDVSFAVTHIDEERGVAIGIITRIIKQNL